MVWGVRTSISLCANYANGGMIVPPYLISEVGSCKPVHPLHRNVDGRVGFCGANVRGR